VAGGNMVTAAVSPGLFTLNQSGTGQAAVVNQDGTINGPNNPAPAGSTIVLYGTGQGQVSPAVADGTAAPSAPLVLGPSALLRFLNSTSGARLPAPG